MDLKFTWTITAGDITTLIGALCVAGAFLFRGGATLTKLQNAVARALEEIGELKTDVKQMGRVLTELAVQKEQITMLTKWYDEIRNRVGWAHQPPKI